MIPSTNTKLLAAEDWTKVYQSFKNADFKSYDFDTLRRVMIQYLRDNYPEEFNDYIDSSEFIALIDLIAYLGQNLSFRIDLNARENFLETASRKDSVLRLAQLISYSPKRNIPASGFLKITAVSTSDNIVDSNNINLANQIVVWNDPSNSNWYQQFITVMNSVMPVGTSFGKPSDSGVISGVTTEQYKIASSNTDVPLFTFTKPINGTPMSFEIVSAGINGKNYVSEESPYPGRQLGFLWKNDNQGAGSANTGFFLYFKQGSLGVTGFNIDTPVANELIGINIKDINESDVWLWQLDKSGNYNTEWKKVDSTVGNNIIYNSLNLNERNVYAVTSRIDDQIDLNFADGNFGNLPKGQFKLFYRQSNGLNYVITPDAMNGIIVKIPYTNKGGQSHTLSVTLALQYSVTNSSPTESIASIKQKAPQAYYLQNRMVTGEDYNVAPVTIAANILKVKSINRQSSGISKYFDLTDVTGKYSQTDIYAHDGIIYKEDNQKSFTFSFNTRNEAFGILKTRIEPLVINPSFRNFYLDNFPRPSLENLNLSWYKAKADAGQTRGFFKNIYPSVAGTVEPVQVGYFSSNNAQYIKPGALIKFTAPTGKFFASNGRLVDKKDSTTKSYLWSKVAKVVGDGSNSGRGLLNDGTGPVILTGYVDEDAIATEIIPNFNTTFSYALENEIVNQMVAKRNFGLSFDRESREWFIIVDTNLDLASSFNLIYQGDTSNLNIDSSWQVAFQWNGKSYITYYRDTNYVFESENQTSFFVDSYKTNFDFVSNTLVKDKISVLGINKIPNLGNTWYNGSGSPQTALGNNGDFYLDTSADPALGANVWRKLDDVWSVSSPGDSVNELGTAFDWQIDSSVVENDGYINPKKVLVSFFDACNDGQIDDPDSFEKVTDSKNPVVTTGYLGNFVYFKKNTDGLRYNIVDKNLFISVPTVDDVPTYLADNSLTLENGQLFYFYTDNVVKSYDSTLDEYIVEPSYFVRSGRGQLKFHYLHNSGSEKRIDPAKTNIIDIYILTSSYDTAYRSWLINGGTEPLPPTTSALEDTYSESLEPIKSISDSLIYHPAKYKILFGDKADANLQATFRAVKNLSRPISDNDLKTRILSAINEFFSIENWEFGDTFHFSELSAYVMNLLTPDITNFIIVPKNGSTFGNLYQISSQTNEIFVSGVTINDIEIISAITNSKLKID